MKNLQRDLRTDDGKQMIRKAHFNLIRSGELKINKFLKDMTYLSIVPHS